MNFSNCVYPVLLVTVQYGEFRDEDLFQDRESILRELDSLRRLRSVELVSATDALGRSIRVFGFSNR